MVILNAGHANYSLSRSHIIDYMENRFSVALPIYHKVLEMLIFQKVSAASEMKFEKYS